MAASKQVGIDFSVDHIKDLLQAFVDARKESAATAKSVVQDAADVAKAMKSLQSSTAKVALQNATIKASPSQSINTSLSGSSLKIDITLKGLAGAASTSGSGGSRGGSGRVAAYPTGPRQQLTRIAPLIQRARSAGDADALADMMDLQSRLEKRIAPRRKSPLMDLIYTSRFNIENGKASPLVGKALDAAGGRDSVMGKTLLGIGILGTAAIELGKLFIDLSNQGKDYLLGINKFNASTGGSALENAKLRGVGIAAGLSTDDMSGLARNLQASITQPGFGMAFGAMLGVHNLPGPMGSQDLAKNELVVANRLRDMWQKDRSPEHANTLRFARGLGQDALIPALKLPNKDWNDAIKSSVSAMPTESQMIQAMKLQAAEGELAQSFGELVASITGKQGLVTAVKSLADLVNNIAHPGTSARAITKDLVIGPVPSLMQKSSSIFKSLLPPRSTGREWWQGPAFGNQNGHPAFASATERARHAMAVYQSEHAGSHVAKLRDSNQHLASAMQTLADAIKKGGGYPGTYGSGNQTRSGALPRALDNGWILNKYRNERAIMLSSF